MIEAVRDISLDDPATAFPVVIDVSQGVGTSSSFAEAMRVLAKLPIKVGIEDQSHRFCYQFV